MRSTNIDSNMKGADYAPRVYVCPNAARVLATTEIDAVEECSVSRETWTHPVSFGDVCGIKDPVEQYEALASIADQCEKGVKSLRMNGLLVVMQAYREEDSANRKSVMKTFKKHGLDPKQGRQLYDTFGNAALKHADQIAETMFKGSIGRTAMPTTVTDGVYQHTSTTYFAYPDTARVTNHLHLDEVIAPEHPEDSLGWEEEVREAKFRIIPVTDVPNAEERKTVAEQMGHAWEPTDHEFALAQKDLDDPELDHGIPGFDAVSSKGRLFRYKTPEPHAE